MLFYITGGAPQAVPGTACVVANQTACTEVCCSSENISFSWEATPSKASMKQIKRVMVCLVCEVTLCFMR
jgi:hypothetical protein